MQFLQFNIVYTCTYLMVGEFRKFFQNMKSESDIKQIMEAKLYFRNKIRKIKINECEECCIDQTR